MTEARGHADTSSRRADALRARHAILSRDIDQLMKHLSTSDLDLRRLKREKLHIKEEIEKIQKTS